MSCIITYKGNKYTQEQFKEYISSNKNEFSHIIASNKNVMDSFKKRMEAIDYVFSQSPKLAYIGSKTQYLQYLDTIFPNSKVNDIVYHGTTSKNKFNKFNSELNNFGGYYFTLNQSIASNYGSAGVITAVINSTNPLNVIDTSSDMPNHPKVTYEPFKDNNYDYVSYKTDFEKDRTYHESVVRDAEQIHILGSKQDIEGFKQFVKKNSTQNEKEGVSEVFENTPELAKIGSKTQYSQYLDTIFPNSKVKDIVYHGTPHGKFDYFDMRNIYTGDKSTIGYYFLDNSEGVQRYTSGEFKTSNDPNILSVILNIKNPKPRGTANDIRTKEYLTELLNTFSQYISKDTKDYLDRYINSSISKNKFLGEFYKILVNEENFSKEIINLFISETGIDGFYQANYNDDSKMFYRGNADVVALLPEQIHILGSKQDIEGFKGFVSNTKSGKDVDNNRDVNNLNFNTLDSEILKTLKDKGWTEEMWNSVSQIEREQAIKCISF